MRNARSPSRPSMADGWMPNGDACLAGMGRHVARLADGIASMLQRLRTAEAMESSHAFLVAIRDASLDLARSVPAGEVGLPLDRVREAFGLSPAEIDLLVLAGLSEEHEGFAAVFRTLHPRGEPRPTTGLAAQLFCQTMPERRMLRQLLESGPAMTHGLLRLTGDAPFVERSVLLAESLWPVLQGIDAWPASVGHLRTTPTTAGLEDWLAEPASVNAGAAIAANEPRTILVTGATEDIALHRAAALGSAVARETACCTLAAGTADLERLAAIHAIARHQLLLVRAARTDGGGAVELSGLGAIPAPVLVAARDGNVALRGRRPVVAVTCTRLAPTARRALWRELFPELAAESTKLAVRYDLEPNAVRETESDVRSLARLDNRAALTELVSASVRTRGALSLSSGVRLIHPTASWNHLVLVPQRIAQLREASDRIGLQGRVLDEWGFLEGRTGARGVRMLFAGPSGTGKTLAAEVMAHTLGVDVLLVDVARVVSKWIGETEKNLAEVFDVAERAQAVLLFDEADALFGKRTEVSDAHDRYANLETAYLLSRLERFDGLAILSTNLKHNIDGAFMRRMEFVVEFEEPGVAERLTLWERHLPPLAPLADDVDLRALAEFYPIVGGMIRNAAVAAGFLAAADGGAITCNHFVRAVRREYDKSGRAFPGILASATASHGEHNV